MLMPFAHISDTHLDCPGSSDFIKRLHREVRDPLENLTCCLQELAARKVAFVLHTGDMVHEGDAGDYAILRRLFDKYLPGVPVIAAMGNHDHRAAFREGFLGIPSPGDEDFTQEVVLDGLRILVLDSAKSGLIGSVSDAQVDWLEERLASPAPRGTFLMMHHPTVCEHPAMALEVSPEFSSLVENSDIHAIFTGHTHSNYNGFFAGKPLYTADSLAFGMLYIQSEVIYTSRSSYNLCWLDEQGRVTTHNQLLYPEVQVLQRKSNAQMIQGLPR